MVKEIIKKIKNIWKTEDQELITTPHDEKVSFELKHGDLTIGFLDLVDGTWTFRYSNIFKSQNNIKPLANFPNKDKEYASESLYPFFLSRIPGLKQPKVQKILEKEHLDEKNEVVLLKRFGELSISNPFRLLAVD